MTTGTKAFSEPIYYVNENFVETVQMHRHAQVFTISISIEAPFCMWRLKYYSIPKVQISKQEAIVIGNDKNVRPVTSRSVLDRRGTNYILSLP